MRMILSLKARFPLVLGVLVAWPLAAAAQSPQPMATASPAKTMEEKKAESKDRPDTWVKLKTKIALLTADDVDGTDIDVDVQEGRVTLSGKADSDAEKAKAERVTKGIVGVKEVRNLLQVVPEARKEMVKATDSEIKEQVEAKLKPLQADKSIGDIKVDNVNAGVVLLHGKATLAQTVRAIEAAKSVPGVRRVASQVQASDDVPEKRY